MIADTITSGRADSWRPRLVCLGMAAFDLTWRVGTLPVGGGKTRANNLHEGGGGMAANAAFAAARLGAEVAFWGRAGNDSAGQALKAELAAVGIDVEGFRLYEGARSSVSGIVVDADGERMIINFRGAGLPTEPGSLPFERLARADAVLADPRWPEGALALFEAARRHGVPTLLDGDVAEPEVFDRLLPHVDEAVFSEPGLAGYAAGIADVAGKLQFARARGCRRAAVTLGDRGVVWLDADGLHRLPAFSVNVVDTTGAGDVFHGALAFAVGAGWGASRAFGFSCAVAAIKCTRPGGREGVPDLETALSLLQHIED